MFILSKDNSENYNARVFKLDAPEVHPNADKLQIFRLNHQQVITNLDYTKGELVVFFPIGCCINTDLVSFFNGFSDSSMNADKVTKGFFEKKGRVRAIRLRGEKVEGFILPAQVVMDFLKINLPPIEGTIFDSYDDIKLCEKYVPPTRNSGTNLGTGNKSKELTLKQRMIEGQFKFHVKTPNLKNTTKQLMGYKDRNVSVTYKVHGTSAIFSNVLVQRVLSWYEKVLIYFGVSVPTTEYKPVYASRQVIKGTVDNELQKEGFYKTNVWKETFDRIMDKGGIPEGYTIYGEIVGFTSDNGYIQGKYDYGCAEKESKLLVYRVTQTNPEGKVIELTWAQIKQFCRKYDLEFVPEFYEGNLGLFLKKNKITSEVKLIEKLTDLYNLEDNCYMCKNSVPTEGIVIKVDDLDECLVFKLKSFAFLQLENTLEEATIEDLN